MKFQVKGQIFEHFVSEKTGNYAPFKSVMIDGEKVTVAFDCKTGLPKNETYHFVEKVETSEGRWVSHWLQGVRCEKNLKTGQIRVHQPKEKENGKVDKVRKPQNYWKPVRIDGVAYMQHNVTKEVKLKD